MRRFTSYFLSFALLCGLSAGSAMAGNSWTVKQIPKANLLQGTCMITKADGSAEIYLGNSPSQTCNTNTWYYSTFHVDTTGFPNNSVMIGWHTQQPSGSQICGRAITYRTNGSVYASSPWSCGGGFNARAVGSPSSLGRVVLEVAMNSSSSSIKPRLRTMTAQIYVP